jgi:hypothetical protein
MTRAGEGRVFVVILGGGAGRREREARGAYLRGIALAV